MSGTLMRPNTAKVERRVAGAVSPTGEPSETPSTIHAALPARIDPIAVNSRQGGNLEYTVEGVVYVSTHVLFADAMMPARFPAGWTPGSTFVVNGVTFTVAANGRAAFPDIQVNDRITDEAGRTFLVLAGATYSDIMPTVQARLAEGRSW